MLSALITIIRRDLLVAFRRRAELMNPILFYVIVVTLFPLGVSPDQEFLSKLAPGVVWVTALLAALISMESIFRQDFDDGSVEQLFLSQHPPTILILGKVIAHWLVTGLPMLVIVPLMALLLYIPQQAVVTLFFTVLIGTPILSLIGAIGVALTAGFNICIRCGKCGNQWHVFVRALGYAGCWINIGTDIGAPGHQCIVKN